MTPFHVVADFLFLSRPFYRPPRFLSGSFLHPGPSQTTLALFLRPPDIAVVAVVVAVLVSLSPTLTLILHFPLCPLVSILYFTAQHPNRVQGVPL